MKQKTDDGIATAYKEKAAFFVMAVAIIMVIMFLPLACISILISAIAKRTTIKKQCGCCKKSKLLKEFPNFSTLCEDCTQKYRNKDRRI